MSFQLTDLLTTLLNYANNVGPGKRFTPAQGNGFGTLQGPTDLCAEQPFNAPRGQAGTFRSTKSLSLGPHNLLKKSRKLSKIRECISPASRRDAQRHTSLLQVCRSTWTWENTW